MTADHIYLHVPFCARRCVYCDFAIAVRRNVPVDEFVDQVQREIEIRFPGAEPREVRSLYLGGGTPSRLGGEGISRVLDALRSRWIPGPGAEVTIEANPEDVSVAAARAWRSAGVNRVSLGVQSFAPAVLQWMHRTHDVAAVYQARDALQTVGVPRLSIDLIFALPEEIPRNWREDLTRAIEFAPDHLSCYGLTLEEGTPLARARRRGETSEALDSVYADEFLETDAMLTSAGFEHYEVSNFAKPGARAVHNSAYWDRVPYLGLGPSAHEFLGGVRRWNRRDYSSWGKALSEGKDPIEGAERPEGEAADLEALFLALRSDHGASWDARDAEMVDLWVAQGWARTVADRVVLTPQGWLRMNALVAALTQRRSRY